MTTHSAADSRLDELRARHAARAAERAAFEERRRHGLRARHEAKLTRLAAVSTEIDWLEEVMLDEPDNSIQPRPEVA